ncbi:MAG: mandelate racemase/muconate lactonizing enzyme family protein [Pedosphaera sp.]|nr:mandelate racemase/muconate lactonizing enzyme family protein [Pedosphaera sp.]MST01260.1 mandelate racemase/muconate lactonizing enzyme family protein [Pedosphaera sp.]
MSNPSPDLLLRRREFLATAGSTAAAWALLQDAAGAENPAANVGDKTSTIRLTSLRTYWVGPIVFLRLETNHGVVGWGEVKGVDPRVSKPLAESIFELLLGENPTRIEHLWQKVYRAHRDIRGGAFLVHTLAGFDMALWDITGKLWGVPIYRMLGGPTRDRIRVYHTAKALKVPPHGIYDHSGTPADIDRMVNAIKAAREQVGHDGVVMFDAHSAVPPATLIQLAAAIKPYDVLFIEEPAVPGNIEVFKRLKQSINIPLATGERDRTIWEFVPYLHERCIDIVQPDCCHTGGITSMKKIATLAEAYHVPLAPHCTANFLGIAASLHVTASIPFFLIHEFYPNNHGFNLKGITRMDHEVDKDGYVTLPPGPGLGVEVDEKLLEAAAKLPQTYKWPGAKLRDGSVADY